MDKNMEEGVDRTTSRSIKEENPETPPGYCSTPNMPQNEVSSMEEVTKSSASVSRNVAVGAIQRVSPVVLRHASSAEASASCLPDSQPVFPQNEVRSLGQVSEIASSQSDYSAFGAAEGVSSDVCGSRLSSETLPSEAVASHLTSLSEDQSCLMLRSPEHSTVSDTAQPRQNLTQDKHSAFPESLQSDSQAMEDSASNYRQFSERGEHPQETPSLQTLQQQTQQLHPSTVKKEYSELLDQSSDSGLLVAFSDKECTSNTHEDMETKPECVSNKEGPESTNKKNRFRTSVSAKLPAQNTESRYRTRRFCTSMSSETDTQNTESKNVTNSSHKSASAETPTQNTESKKERRNPSRSTSAKVHTEASSKTPNNTCPECKKTFSRPYGLTLHMRVHTGDRPFECKECDATYKISSHLQNHIRSKHSNAKAYKCDTCSKAFSTMEVKRRHEKNCGMTLSERVKYQCAHCQRNFVSEHGYQRHKKDICGVNKKTKDVDNDSSNTEEAVSKQEEEDRFKCAVCQKSFAEFPSLDTHQRFLCGKGPGAAPYTCAECQKVFSRWTRFVSHCRCHTGDKPFVCSKCGARFSERDNLRKHESRHREANVSKCTLCEKQCGDKKKLSVHIMRSHCGLMPFKCNECEKDFASAKHLSTHIRAVHRKEKRFKCQVCERGFFRSEDWKRHMTLHARPPKERVKPSERQQRGGPFREYFCNFCGANLNMIRMRRHVEEEHPGVRLSEAISKDLVACEVCQKEFCNPNSLEAHMKRRHSEGPKDFKCDKCDMCFFLERDLKVHEIKHTDERPCKCEECGETFRWNASLREHRLRLHNPDLDPPDDMGRRFACEVCGRRFMRVESLKFHKMRHSGNFPHICSKCGKGFPHVTALRSHMSCHSSADMPFMCEKCGAGFYYASLLRGHIKRRHNPSPWLCYLCGRTQCSKNSLKLHIQAHAKYPDGIIRGGRHRFRKPGTFTESSIPKTY